MAMLPQSSVRSVMTVVLLSALCAIASPAQAQGSSGCWSRQPPSVGAAFGRSSPYLYLAADSVDVEADGSVSVDSGAQIAGRADLPVIGPLRLRVEGSTARWNVRRKTYDPAGGFRLIEDTSVGRMTARHLVALVGLRTGRPPACAHVSAGGGLYSLGFRGNSSRRPGVALAAGIEIPTGDRGAVQADVTLHLIVTRDGHPITSSTAVPAASLLVGWAYRF